MTSYVLDSSAILARLFGELGGDVVEAGIAESFLSAANFAEIITKLIDRGVSADDARDAAFQLRCEIVPVDEERAAAAGVLHALTRRKGVSLGDRFCLALAEELGLPALTADRRWRDLDIGVEVTLIR
ncbi:MAG: PIN domain-containing protein [Caulobacterales bacterium]